MKPREDAKNENHGKKDVTRRDFGKGALAFLATIGLGKIGCSAEGKKHGKGGAHDAGSEGTEHDTSTGSEGCEGADTGSEGCDTGSEGCGK